ncbi:mitochondrial uncoupling protein 3 [Olea europaea var. sylvestris]|uniref:Mitochondrial uncoupling 3 n=1 Tax=Olea europaea subsp. europaea TaxID=158383 RepID=A0A8S0P6J9_OLEEU|nr:mitochondrial uncoupling protein 3 [Olea europaea var. sylvestris]CAA2933650.1 mitochondrial uncoupling 3 [Olea europaea subsp. europaea]
MAAGDDNRNRRTDSDVKKILLTSLSAMIAETTTFPIDLIKTRLQLHGESLPSTRQASAFRIVFQIAKDDGVFGLYRGLSPAVVRHFFYTPIRIVGYEHLRNLVPSYDNSPSLFSKAVMGGVSGVIAQVISSPADLVKVRMQADGRMVSQGLQPRYAGIFDALKKIFHAEGFGGFWKGVFPNVQRAFLVNMGELACYDHAKRLVIKNQICNDNIYAHTLSSIMSGLSATALSCPADVVKTRMMNQAVNDENKVKYKNSYDCLVKTVRIEGLRALWKGFFPTWARLGPWQFVFWVSYEKFRQIAGLKSF